MSDILDDVAAFLMHRTAAVNLSENQRLSIFVLVGAHQHQDDPPGVSAARGKAAGAFADHPDYRAEWAVREGEKDITIERLMAAVEFSIDPRAAVLSRATT